MAVDWALLPSEIVETISKRLTNYSDYLNCRAVCRNWKSSIPKTPSNIPPQLPWLMLRHLNPNRSRVPFFNFSANKLHSLKLPEASHRNRLCGSSHGWLIILDDSPRVRLLNPISRYCLALPPLSSFPHVLSFNCADVGREYAFESVSGGRFTCDLKQMRDCFIKKVVLSSRPSEGGDFIAMAILNQTGDLAYCKYGDQSWSIIENGRSFCEDVIYTRGSFYAVNKVGQIAVCSVDHDIAKVSFIQTDNQIGGDLHYLVSCGDELLLVTRYLEDHFEDEIAEIYYRTTGFEVFRLDWNKTQWIKVPGLGEYALFIGQNSSSSFSSKDFPGCIGNCIYYTDEFSYFNYEDYFVEYDLGVFKLSDESIKPLSCYLKTLKSGVHMPPPIWVSPNPC